MFKVFSFLGLSVAQADCQSNKDCNGELPVCYAGSCVECTGNGDCESNPSMVDAHKLACKKSDNVCVECTGNGDCENAFALENKLICFQNENLCVECTRASQCSNVNLPECDIDKKICVECTSDGDCIKDPDKDKCDRGVCTKKCRHDSDDCKIIPSLPTCTTVGSTETGFCVQCTSDGDCEENSIYSDENKLKCNKDINVCGECTGHDDCKLNPTYFDDNKLVCRKDKNICIECNNNGDCGFDENKGKCLNHHCVGRDYECDHDNDCRDKENLPFCLANHVCGVHECEKDTDCKNDDKPVCLNYICVQDDNGNDSSTSVAGIVAGILALTFLF